MAKNIIDALVVTLGLDNTLFKKGIKDSDKIQDEHEGKTKKIDKQRHEAELKEEREKQRYHKEQLHRNREELDGFTKLRNETIALLTVFTAGKGIIDFLTDTIRITSSLGFLSDNIGVGIGQLEGWQYAIKEVGGTTEGAAASMNKAAEAVADFKLGINSPTIQGFFTAAGGTGVNTNGAFKDVSSFLKAQADVVHALYLRNPLEAMTKARQMMGIDPDTFNLMKRGSAYMLQRIDLGDRMSMVTKKTAAEAQQAMREWVEVSTRLETVGRKILFSFLPVLTAFGKWLTGHSKDIDHFVNTLVEGINHLTPEALEKVGTALSIVAAALQLTADSLESINESGKSLGLWTSEKDKEKGAIHKGWDATTDVLGQIMFKIWEMKQPATAQNGAATLHLTINNPGQNPVHKTIKSESDNSTGGVHHFVVNANSGQH